MKTLQSHVLLVSTNSNAQRKGMTQGKCTRIFSITIYPIECTHGSVACLLIYLSFLLEELGDCINYTGGFIKYTYPYPTKLIREH